MWTIELFICRTEIFMTNKKTKNTLNIKKLLILDIIILNRTEILTKKLKFVEKK